MSDINSFDKPAPRVSTDSETAFQGEIMIHESNTNSLNLESAYELAKWLQTPRRRVYALIRQGMPHVRLGSQYRFDRRHVSLWLLKGGGSDGGQK